MVPLDQLCVEAGKAVWALQADVVTLNSDGNLIDASLAAVVAALRARKFLRALQFVSEDSR